MPLSSLLIPHRYLFWPRQFLSFHLSHNSLSLVVLAVSVFPVEGVLWVLEIVIVVATRII